MEGKNSLIAQMKQRGEVVEQVVVEVLRRQYGLDRPGYAQYFKWMWKMLHRDFGFSYTWNKPVNDLLWERLGLTITVSTVTLLFTWLVGFVIGPYSAPPISMAGNTSSLSLERRNANL